MKSNALVAGPLDVLLVIDVQNDFCLGGAMAVPGGDEIIPLVNRVAARFQNAVLTQDWHPPRHSSFASSYRGKEPFDTVDFVYGQQILWPDHCIQGTDGAAFHPALNIPHASLVLRKGCNPNIDSYSAFFENDRTTPTGLGGYLCERGFQRVFIAGLALDFCVRFSAEDARRLGFETFVIEDASRAIDQAGSLGLTLQSFDQLSIGRIFSSALSVAESSAVI